MRHQEKFLPKIVRHPGSERARDEQTADNIFPYSKQIHDEVVTRSRETILRGDALPERAFGHAHVHFSVAFHFAFESLVRLCARFGYELARQE